jgi:hypothetical protein
VDVALRVHIAAKAAMIANVVTIAAAINNPIYSNFRVVDKSKKRLLIEASFILKSFL